MVDVIYTGKVELGGAGIGKTALHQVKPLIEKNLLKRAYVANTVPEFKEYVTIIPTVKADYASQDLMFDSVTSLVAQSSKLLQSWLSHSLFTMQSLNFEYKVVNCFSAHVQEQEELIEKAIGPTMIIHPLLKEKIIREMKLATHILCPSEFVFESLKKHGLASKAQIIPFGVDTEKFVPGKKLDEKFRILFIGRNWIRKGLIYLLSAWNNTRTS